MHRVLLCFVLLRLYQKVCGIYETREQLFFLSNSSFYTKHFVLAISRHNLYPGSDSRFAPSQWETALLCNDVSHWLGANLESALLPFMMYWRIAFRVTLLALGQSYDCPSVSEVIGKTTLCQITTKHNCVKKLVAFLRWVVMMHWLRHNTETAENSLV